MITITPKISELLNDLNHQERIEALTKAWDACCDGELLAKEYPEVDFDPWDGKHEDYKAEIELDMIKESIKIVLEEREVENEDC